MITNTLFVWLVAGADLFWEKSIAVWLLVSSLFWEKNTADWWLISQTNRVKFSIKLQDRDARSPQTWTEWCGVPRQAWTKQRFATEHYLDAMSSHFLFKLNLCVLKNHLNT
jgi:hypothetical protein